MVSRTRLTAQVRAFDVMAVYKGLLDNPELLHYRDSRGRNWLHLTASIDVHKHPELDPDQSIRLAESLIQSGLGVDEPAFSEGDWQATPLWYAVARGRNLPLATWLLDAGASPEHCLWAAAFRDDEAMLKLLVDRGANIDAVAEDETPLLGAVKVSRFLAVRILLEAGADPDVQDGKGMTALHYMLKKGSASRPLRLLAEHGARGDIPGPDGRTAIQILSSRRDPVFQEIAGLLDER